MKHANSRSVFSYVRWLGVATLVLVVVALLVTPGSAITYGIPDGDDHPNVGSMVLFVPGQGNFQFCTGTLIAPTIFLTASHCTAAMESILVNNPSFEMRITFDPSISDNSTFYSGTMHTHPEYTGLVGLGAPADPHDIAVIELEQALGITPAQLPSAGFLDQLKDSKELKNARFTAVGYGTVRQTHTTGWQGILGNLDRNRTEQGFSALLPSWLILPMLPQLDSGGTCYGDSGGPHFIHQDGVETDIVVSITVNGDNTCKATDVTYRTDTASARAFLSKHVTLP